MPKGVRLLEKNRAGVPSSWNASWNAGIFEIRAETEKKGENEAGVPRSRKVLREKKEKGIDKQYENLLELTLIVYNHYPNIRTKNPYQRLTDRVFKARAELNLLFIKLVHSLTVLHHTTRYQNKSGEYESSREDILATLQLMKHQVNAHIMLNKEERIFYRDLLSHFAGSSFTRHQVQQQLAGSRTRTQQKLNKLYHANLVEREGYINKGYRYRLK